jgi:hypothetical protein
MLYLEDKTTLAYVIGLALGDGNLSQVSRAIRLRITCDLKYPNLIETIQKSLQIIAPQNKVGIAKKRGNCLDIYCYSNQWPKVLGWNVGSKISQNVTVPSWIRMRQEYSKACLRGLFQTDGCLYYDSGYQMAAFTSHISSLAENVIGMIQSLGFKPTIYERKYTTSKIGYTIRVSRNSALFIKTIGLWKS